MTIELMWREFLEPVALSLQVTLTASIFVFLLGLLAAYGLARRRFIGKALVETLLMLPLVLPPTVVGFLLLVLIGKNGPFGRIAEAWLHSSIVFSWWSAVLASTVVAFPLVYQTVKVGFLAVDRSLEDAARTDGGSSLQVLLHITLPLSSRAMGIGFVLGFARSLGEFGATLMVAGNIPGKTQTMPTAIYAAVESGRWGMAWWWTGTMVALSFVLMLIAGRAPRA